MERKIKVLMAGPDPDAQGGVASVAKNYVEGGLADACDLRYVKTMAEGGKPRKLAIAIAAYLEFSGALRDADVVHLHMSKGASYARKRFLALRAKRVGVPYVIHLHTGEFGMLFEAVGDKKKEEIRSLFCGAAAVIALSEEWGDYLAANVCPAEKVEVVYNAVAVPSAPCSPCAHQGVLFLGRLDANKSPDVLLFASKRALSRHPGARILLAGDGEPGRYAEIARELGIADRCDFLGWVSGEGKEALFDRTAVYCLPSRAEGMPMALLEAMAHGLPVIATEVGGIPSVIEDGENGFLMAVGDDESMAALLDRLLSDGGLRTRMGLAARRTVEEKFAMAPHVKRLISIYEKAVSAKEAEL